MRIPAYSIIDLELKNEEKKKKKKNKRKEEIYISQF